MDKEQKRAKNAAYYRANRERLIAKESARYRANPEAGREYRRKNAKILVQRTAKWIAENPDRHLRNQKAAMAVLRGRRRGTPGYISGEDVRNQFNAQNGLCFYCSEPMSKYQIDHKQPLSRGGTNWPENIVCSCPGCNMRKGTKTAEEFLKERG